jgi:flavin reductase (DIM6/NTAB) family NADH-FMN oxidoreductase RutF
MSTQETSSAIDPGRFRSVMGRFATGVTVVSASLEGQVHCMTANAFMSGSLEPPLCVISVGRAARMHDVLARARHFAVSVLAEHQEQYSRHFSGRLVEGFAPSFEYAGEIPLLADRLAAIAARVKEVHPCGDHSLFVGEILHMSAEGLRKPLVFYGGRYAALVHPAGLSLPTPEFW